MTQKTSTAAPIESKALLSGPLDLLCIGGAPLLAIGTLFVLRPNLGSQSFVPLFFALSALLNWPHFMSSYRVLYRSKESIRRYPWAAIGVPTMLILFSMLAVALHAGSGDTRAYRLLEYSGSVYLAWHYTGQTWGVTATFASLNNVRFADNERRVLRLVLRVFLVWHLSLFHAYAFGAHGIEGYPWLNGAFVMGAKVATVSAHVGAVVAAVVFLRIARRIGRIPVAAMLPIVALYAGYLLVVFTGRDGLVIMQLAHSAQYLLFTTRVEMNRLGDAPRRGVHLLGYFSLLFLSGAVFFAGPERLGILAPEHQATIAFAGACLVLVINVHHYFLDSCIWRLSNPDVRRDLFSHLNR